MGTVSDLVAEVQTAGAFDVTASDALTVLNRRHKMMCRRARWHRLTKTLTATTAADASYSTVSPVGLVEAFAVEAIADDDSGITRSFTRTREGDRGAILAGELVVEWPGAVFLENDEDDETDTSPDTSLLLFPAVENGASVVVRGAFDPPALLTAETAGAFVRVPVDFHEALLSGVYASLLSRPGEARLDLAAAHESAFSAACSELRSLADRRFRTRGPRQIRLARTY